MQRSVYKETMKQSYIRNNPELQSSDNNNKNTIVELWGTAWIPLSLCLHLLCQLIVHSHVPPQQFLGKSLVDLRYKDPILLPHFRTTLNVFNGIDYLIPKLCTYYFYIGYTPGNTLV